MNTVQLSARPQTAVLMCEDRRAVVWCFVGASAAINLVWFVVTLFDEEVWGVALGGIGIFGQGELLSLQLAAGHRLARRFMGAGDDRRRSNALTLISLGQ